MTILNEASDILTIPEIRDILYIGKNQAYDLIRSGELKGFKIGRGWRVSKSALLVY